jgi:hypothetical protein
VGRSILDSMLGNVPESRAARASFSLLAVMAEGAAKHHGELLEEARDLVDS